jgi:hypothetical protein
MEAMARISTSLLAYSFCLGGAGRQSNIGLSNSTKVRHPTKFFTTIFKLKAQSKFTAETPSSSANPKIKHKMRSRT